MKKEFKDTKTEQKILAGDRVHFTFDFPDEETLKRVGLLSKFLENLLEKIMVVQLKRINYVSCG